MAARQRATAVAVCFLLPAVDTVPVGSDCAETVAAKIAANASKSVVANRNVDDVIMCVLFIITAAAREEREGAA